MDDKRRSIGKMRERDAKRDLERRWTGKGGLREGRMVGGEDLR
jgi:hypothetical protein